MVELGSRVQIEGVSEEAAGLVSLKPPSPNRIKLSDLFGITTSAKWST